MAVVDYLSMNEKVDPERIGILGICGWGGMAINTAALDTRVKALRECADIRIENSDIISQEFGWSIRGIVMKDTRAVSE